MCDNLFCFCMHLIMKLYSMRSYVCMYVCLYVCMYVCMCVCVYVCVYVLMYDYTMYCLYVGVDYTYIPGVLSTGHVRSQCLTCTFRASCCSARLSRAQVPAFAIKGKKGGGSKGYRLHWRVQGSTSSPTEIGSRLRVV